MASRTRVIVYGGMVAAVYFVATVAIAPMSYGPVQFRVSELLKPLALYDPFFAVAFLVGNSLANLFSPFGPWDYIVMPIVDCCAALVCWQLRRWPYVAIIVQAIIISAGVAAFPLGMVLGLPFLPTFASVLVSELILLIVGYVVIWRKYESDLLR
jgi:uncharacterized membrane protein